MDGIKDGCITKGDYNLIAGRIIENQEHDENNDMIWEIFLEYLMILLRRF